MPSDLEITASVRLLLHILTVLVLAGAPNAFCPGAEPNGADAEVACRKASEHIEQGRYDEALDTLAIVEEAIRANRDRRPGTVIYLLMTKARVYTSQRDPNGLERFLTQFEREYADTPIANWVQRVACDRRVLCYRLMDDLPRVVQAMEKERELLDTWESATGPNEPDDLEALGRGFYVHVWTPVQIGDIYRYMGRPELALENYRQALAYLTARAEALAPLHASIRKQLSRGLTPPWYREALLPRVIRDCEAPGDSPLGILGRTVACEVEQADWLLRAADTSPHCRWVHDLAIRRYRKAQMALDANQDTFESLDPGDKARYLELRKQIAMHLE